MDEQSVLAMFLTIGTIGFVLGYFARGKVRPADDEIVFTPDWDEDDDE